MHLAAAHRDLREIAATERLLDQRLPAEQAVTILRGQFGLPPPETSRPELTCGPAH
jgi:hypothetical protein